MSTEIGFFVSLRRQTQADPQALDPPPSRGNVLMELNNIIFQVVTLQEWEVSLSCLLSEHPASGTARWAGRG